MSAYPKRLIEVDLPIKRISAHARREKSIRHGHISTLHIWWARRPLAACRAVICAALWPDPADPLCPQSFREKAVQLINNFAKQACVRMLSANSFRLVSSKLRRGLVVDSVSNARETSRYSVGVVIVGSIMNAPFERLGRTLHRERAHLPRPPGDGRGQCCFCCRSNASTKPWAQRFLSHSAAKLWCPANSSGLKV